MSPWSLPPFASSILFVSFMVFVWLQPRRSVLHRILAGVCFVTAWWQASWALLFSVSDPALAALLVKVGHVGILFIPWTLFHFYVEWLDSGRDRFFVKAGYLIGSLFLFILLFSDLLIDGFHSYEWGFYPRAGLFHPLMIAGIAAVSMRVIYLLAVASRRGSQESRRLNRLLLIGFLFYVTAASDFFVNYGAGFYPIGFISITLMLASLIYAIRRHRFMGIRFTGADRERLQILLGATGSLSHEVRNPLAFIIQDVDDPDAGLERFSTAEVRKRLVGIRKQTARVAEITRSMSKYARPVKEAIRFEAVSVNEAAEAAIAEVKKGMLLTGIKTEFRNEIPTELSKASGDAVFIRESLVNFLSNGLEALTKAGRQDGVITITAQPEGKKIRLSVSDNGCGVPEEALEKVFELGYSTRDADGLKHGAGLFLVKWYADQMKAELKIESAAGQGTTVSMILAGVR